ncbi:hypothetical protein ACJMK2_014889 [Sinanodonta woodiana]|uniref:AIG1-type G domain-containing protein n=1 Tax=Sinanodonta woodiana TaxID=1069815 RepID=A0ABD3V542_SINWO
MLVGATASGKRTLINGMVNYILGIEWEDKGRVTIIDLTDEEKVKNEGIQTLDALCFVAQAPLTRLTPHQRYIFDSILSIFGNDISKNIFVLVTFADGNEPPVKLALEVEQVPFQKTFKFNNSALFVNTENKKDTQISQMFWKMGRESFHVFFTELAITKTESLHLTVEVLKTRQKLEATIRGLPEQIHTVLSLVNTIKQEKQVVDKHRADILANNQFEYEIEVLHEKVVPVDVGTYTTNCMSCNRTCHYPCDIPCREGKFRCTAMDSNGYCTVCPNHCFWNNHTKTQHRYEVCPVKVKRTSDELKKQYDIALGKQKKHSEILQKMKAQFNKISNSVYEMIKSVQDCINYYNQKVIKQNPLSQVEYIELLIESEKSEARYGWQQNVEMLQSFKKQAELMKDISNQEFKPWSDADVDDC